MHDNAANMTPAMQLLLMESDWDHQPCVAHTLQLSVLAGLKQPTRHRKNAVHCTKNGGPIKLLRACMQQFSQV